MEKWIVKSYNPHRRLFSPSSLFAAGEQGAWYDPSDLSTLFTDSAGTTPVTAVEQSVGLMLDKSKGLVLGPELVTTASIDGLPAGGGARTYSTGATVAAGRWYVIEADVTDYVGTSVVGFATSNGVFSSISAISGNGKIRQYRFTGASGTVNLFTLDTNTANFRNISVRELPGNHAYQTTATSRPVLSARYNLYLSTETLSTQNVTTVATSYRLRFEGAGTITLSGTATGTYSAGTHTITCTAGTLTSTVAGTVSRADLRVANDGVNIPPYQRVNTATDYDTAGFPLYLRCDGVDDGMVTNSIDFTGTDKMTVVAGVRKLSGVIGGVVAEIGPNINTTSGVGLFAPSNVGLPDYAFVSRGSATASAIASGFVAPTTNVLSGLSNVSGDSLILRVNGAQAASSITDQGTGNFGKYPLYLFRRGGTTAPFNGRFYGMVVRGAQSTDAQIQSLESYMNVRTKAY